MKIIYIADNRIPTEKANGIQIAKMCEAFGDRDLECTLILPQRRNVIKEDLFSYYRIKKNFNVVYLPSIDLIGTLPLIGFWIQALSFSLSVKKYLKKIKYQGIIYSRDQFSLWLLKNNHNLDLTYEMHNYPRQLGYFYRTLFNKIKVVCISNGLRDKLLQDGLRPDKLLVAPDGVDLSQFTAANQDKKSLRKKLDLVLDQKIVMYTGHLYAWKGVETLLRAAQQVKAAFYIIGGTKDDIVRLREKYKNFHNIFILGYLPHYQMPEYLKAADVLVLPNSGQEQVSKYYTSPLKLFEYMASGVPIVASDLPSIREILNQNNSYLVRPDDEQSLAEGINKVLGDDKLAESIARQSWQDVQRYLWLQRATNIVDFLRGKSIDNTKC